MHQQPHPTHAPPSSPALYRVLPAEIPDAHPVFTETPNVMRVGCAFGSLVEDRIGVQKNPSRSQEVIKAAHLTGRYLRPAEVVPPPLRARQYEAQLLHPRVAVDDDELRPIYRKAACSDSGGGPGRSIPAWPWAGQRSDAALPRRGHYAVALPRLGRRSAPRAATGWRPADLRGS